MDWLPICTCGFWQKKHIGRDLRIGGAIRRDYLTERRARKFMYTKYANMEAIENKGISR